MKKQSKEHQKQECQKLKTSYGDRATLKRNKVKAYETAYIQEKFLKLRAVNELRKHEERMFGE